MEEDWREGVVVVFLNRPLNLPPLVVGGKMRELLDDPKWEREVDCADCLRLEKDCCRWSGVYIEITGLIIVVG